MSKKIDDELDFGNSNYPVSKHMEYSKPLVEKKSIILTGIILAIPTKNPLEWRVRDLAECTGREFVEWLSFTYPVIDKQNIKPSDYDTKETRQRTYDSVVRFYEAGNLFSAKKNSGANT